MLGQPITMKLPEVVGVRLTGELPRARPQLTSCFTSPNSFEGRRRRPVCRIFGPGVSNLTVPDRATIANMAPEQGSTISMFGVDEATLDYLELTGRDEEHIELVREYFDAQGLFGEQNPEYSETVEFDLSTITPSLAGPKKPQDRVAMGDMKTHFRDWSTANSRRNSTISTRKRSPDGSARAAALPTTDLIPIFRNRMSATSTNESQST